jgi:type II secretory pathway component PulF
MKKEAKEKAAVFFSLAVMTFLVGAAFYVMVKVVPQYSQAYSGLRGGLPSLTVVCFKISNLLKANFFIFLGAALLGIIAALALAFMYKKRILLAELFTLAATLSFCLIMFSFYATRAASIQVDKTTQAQLEGFDDSVLQ